MYTTACIKVPICVRLILLCLILANIASAYVLQNVDYGREGDMATLEFSERRDFLKANVAFLKFGIAATFHAKSANAVSLPDIVPRETSLGEALRRSAANIPGYGPTDVFYPLTWQGTWTLRREDLFMIDGTPQNYTYPVRFIQSVDKSAVIADRTYNELNYWETVQKGERTGNTIQSIEWTETNPNDLNILFTNGLRQNVKVTKRASETTDTTVSSSEFQRILKDTSSMDGITVPQVASRRTLTKWKMIANNRIEAIEIVYDMNVEGDATVTTRATGPGTSTSTGNCYWLQLKKAMLMHDDIMTS